MKKIAKEEHHNDLEIAMNEFSAVQYLVLDKKNSYPKLNCFTYIYLALDAFIKYYKNYIMKLNNVNIFHNPKFNSNEKREYRILIKKEEYYSFFIIFSRLFDKSEEKWEKHAEGIMTAADFNNTIEINSPDNCIFKIINISSLEFDPLKECLDFNLADSICTTGATIEFKIAANIFDLFSSHYIHPCGIDYIISLLVKNIYGDEWFPVSCNNLEFYCDLKIDFFVYISENVINTNKSQSKKEHHLNFVFYDDKNKIIIKIDDYYIRHRDYEKCNAIIYQNDDLSNKTKDKKGRKDLLDYINGLTWRQMNCYERCIALLLGYENESYVNYFKLFISLLTCYNIEDCLTCILPITDFLNMIAQSLKILGYDCKVIHLNNSIEINKLIISYLDTGKAVGALFDEYYIYYTNFYLKVHNNHIAIINGYNSEKKIYNIIDHNHLSVGNEKQSINYGPFYTFFDVIEKVYHSREEDSKYIILVDKENRGSNLHEEEPYHLFVKAIKYILKTEQSSNEIRIIYDKIKRNDISFDAAIVDKLYKILGKKELLIDTILYHFCADFTNIEIIKELSFQIISDLNILINKYIESLLRGKSNSHAKMLDMIDTINKNTFRFLEEITK